MPGGLDSNGIYQYAPSDLASPFDGLLNLGMDSVSDKVAAILLELRSAGAAAALLPSSPWTVFTSLGTPSLVLSKGMVHLTVGAIGRNTALTVAPGTTQAIATVPPALVSSGDYLPTHDVYGVGTIFAGSSTPVGCYVNITTAGVVSFNPFSSVTFTVAGGATNTVRIPTISWVAP